MPLKIPFLPKKLKFLNPSGDKDFSFNSQLTSFMEILCESLGQVITRKKAVQSVWHTNSQQSPNVTVSCSVLTTTTSVSYILTWVTTQGYWLLWPYSKFYFLEILKNKTDLDFSTVCFLFPQNSLIPERQSGRRQPTARSGSVNPHCTLVYDRNQCFNKWPHPGQCLETHLNINYRTCYSVGEGCLDRKKYGFWLQFISLYEPSDWTCS